ELSTIRAMRIDFTVKNNRCFRDTHPASLTLEPGFTSFVGKNNAGKSALVRLFYDLRHLFQVLKEPGNLNGAWRGGETGFNLMPPVQDWQTVPTDGVDRPMSIGLRLSSEDWDTALLPDQ